MSYTTWHVINRCTDRKCDWNEGTLGVGHWTSAMALQMRRSAPVCPDCGCRTERAVGRKFLVERGGWLSKHTAVDHVEWKDRPRAEPVELTPIPNRRSIGQTVRGLLR